MYVLHRERGGSDRKSLEGSSTYKSDEMLYNDVVDEGGAAQVEKRGITNGCCPRKGDTVRAYGKAKYKSSLADEMTAFFEGYEEAFGAPSFEKFARLKGMTVNRLESFRSHEKFNRAYLECSEIRRDYLIDKALCKRFDPTFVRHLISDEQVKEQADTVTSFTLRVIE